MTKGSVPKVLLQFAVPYLLANVLQALYGGADLFVVGQFDDPASVAGVAIGSQVMQTITGIILGLTTGTTILIGIATGAGNDRQNFGAGLYGRMDSCLRSGITMALVFGISICVYSQFMPETLTSIFSKDAPVVSMAAEYLRGYSIDCIIVSFVFCINSYFSGQGNSIFPMIHSMIATFLFRIPLSWICSRADPGSLVWMGYAPPASTMVSLAICFWYLRRSRRGRKARQDSAPGISSISTS